MSGARSGLVVAAVAATLAAGCGGSGAGARAHTGSQSPSASGSSGAGGSSGSGGSPGAGGSPGSGTVTIPTPAPTNVAPHAADVGVIRGWANALRRGDVRAAARYFALPSEMINGPDPNGRATVLSIRTSAEAQAANATLPCGADFISADQRGRYVNALFRLTDRPGPGGGCGSGSGQPARTNFVIVAGRIVEWIRAPADPGDNGEAAPPGPAPPSTPQASPVA